MPAFFDDETETEVVDSGAAAPVFVELDRSSWGEDWLVVSFDDEIGIE